MTCPRVVLFSVKNKQTLILASASPRRKDLLAEIGLIPDHIIPTDIDETPFKGEKPRAYVKRMAVEKAAALTGHDDAYVLAADTVVVMGTRILQKPIDADESYKFLSLMSGRRHTVMGGICLRTPNGNVITRLCETKVKFKSLSEDEKRAYVASNEWDGKAGGYAIQGRASAFVPFISGSYSNIVGLSLHDTVQMLRGNGFTLE
jgi:septum formation protein